MTIEAHSTGAPGNATEPLSSPESGSESFRAHVERVAAQGPPALYVKDEDGVLTQVAGCYIGPGGLVVRKTEAVELFYLLEDNAREWNRRLRVALAAYILYLLNSGKLEGPV